MEDRREILELKLEPESSAHIREGAKWARFLGIIGFIGTGLMVILAFYIMSQSAAVSRYGAGASIFIAGIFYLVIAVLYFMPVLYFFRFGKQVIKGIDSNDQELFSKGIANMKSCFKFLGILTSVILGFYAIIIIVAIINQLTR